MIRKRLKLAACLTENEQIRLRLGRKTYDLGLDEALAYAYALVTSRQYEAGARVCELAARFDTHARRAAILQARCEAGRRDYAACHDVLREKFIGRDEPIAEDLHAAFVYHNMGLYADAIRELATVVQERPDLPTACLLLGDLFARVGQRNRAVWCWQSAIRRDSRSGSAARAARAELSRLGKAR